MPDWSIESLRFLSHEQALADFAFFIESMQAKIKREFNISTSWIMVGGSYAGGLAAWFRFKYPHLVVGALASSGVLTPVADFWQFEKQIIDDLLQSGEYCLNIVKHFQNVAEAKLFSPDKNERINFIKTFGGLGNETNEEFMYFYADVHCLMPQYSHREDFCKALKKINESQLSIQNQIEEYAKLAVKNGVSLQKYTYRFRGNTIINNSTSSRQWGYQFCTTYGWFQTNYRPSSLRWKGMTLDYWHKYCREFIGSAVSPKIEHTSIMYGAEDIVKYGSNIIFTQGKDDPWRWVGINENTAENPKVDVLVVNCNDCGHCIELYTPTNSDQKEVNQTREIIKKRFKTWLK